MTKTWGKQKQRVKQQLQRRWGSVLFSEEEKNHRSGWDATPGSLVTAFAGPGV
jgi:hypothetical protein